MADGTDASDFHVCSLTCFSDVLFHGEVIVKVKAKITNTGRERDRSVCNRDRRGERGKISRRRGDAECFGFFIIKFEAVGGHP